MAETFGLNIEENNSSTSERAASYCQEQIEAGLYSEEDLKKWAEELLGYTESIDTSDNDQMAKLISQIQKEVWKYKTVRRLYKHADENSGFAQDCLLGEDTKEAIELAIGEKQKIESKKKKKSKRKTRKATKKVAKDIQSSLGSSNDTLEVWPNDAEANYTKKIDEPTGLYNKDGKEIRRIGIIDVSSENTEWILGSSTVVGMQDLPEGAGRIGMRGMGPKALDKYMRKVVIPELKKRKIKVPKKVTIIGAAINGLMGASVAETVSNYEKLAATLEAIGVEEVIFSTVQPYPEIEKKIGQFNDAIRDHSDYDCADLAAGVTTEDGKWEKGMYAKGGLHLNAKGYKIFSANLKKKMLEDYEHSRVKRMYA